MEQLSTHRRGFMKATSVIALTTARMSRQARAAAVRWRVECPVAACHPERLHSL